MTITLRDGQKELVKKVKDYYKEKDHGLVVAPTGYGKTYSMMACINTLKYKKILVLQHRYDLVEQNSSAAKKILDRTVSKYRNFKGEIVFSMIQTAFNRLDELKSIGFDFIIVDEAHHVNRDAKTYRGLLDEMNISSLGFTATPNIQKGSLYWWKEIIYSKDINDAINEGILTPAKVLGLIRDTDSSKYRNIELKCLGNTIALIKNTTLSRIYRENGFALYLFTTWTALAANRKTLFFCNLVATAKFLSNYFSEKGIRSCVVSGSDNQTTQDFKNGMYDVCFNVMKLTEGFDCPEISCIGIVTHLKSESSYIQSVGRGLRLAPNKEDCIVLDYGASSQRYGTFEIEYMVQCKYSKCNKMNIKGRANCIDCGSYLRSPIVCPDCEFPNKANSTICEKCNALLLPEEEKKEYKKSLKPKREAELYSISNGGKEKNKIYTFRNRFALKLNDQYYELNSHNTGGVWKTKLRKIKKLSSAYKRSSRTLSTQHMGFYKKQIKNNNTGYDFSEVDIKDFWQVQTALAILTKKVKIYE